MRRANGRTTHQPQVPDHVALPRLPSKSSAKKGGKGQRGEGQGQISKQETSTEEQSSPKQRNVNVLERSRRGRGAAGTGPRGGEAGASPRSTPLRCRDQSREEAKQGGRWVQEAGTGQPGVPARQRPARWRGTYQCVPREHLQQRDEVVSIPQVLVEVVDVALRLRGWEAALPRCHTHAAAAATRRSSPAPMGTGTGAAGGNPHPSAARCSHTSCLVPNSRTRPQPRIPPHTPPSARRGQLPSLCPRDQRPGGLGAGSFMHVAPPPTMLVATGPSAPVRVRGSSEKRKERGEGQPVPGEGAHLPLLASAAARRRAREKRERLGEAGGEETGWRPGARGHPEVPSPRHGTRRRRAGPPARRDTSVRGGWGRRLGVCQALTRALPAAQQGRVPARSQGPGWVWQERGAGGTGERETGGDGRTGRDGGRQQRPGTSSPSGTEPAPVGTSQCCRDGHPGAGSGGWQAAKGTSTHRPRSPQALWSPRTCCNKALWKVPALPRPGHGPRPHVGAGGTAVMAPAAGRAREGERQRRRCLKELGAAPEGAKHRVLPRRCPRPATHRCCRDTSRSGAQGQAGWGFERPGLVGGVPAHVRGLELGGGRGPFQPNRSAIL